MLALLTLTKLIKIELLTLEALAAMPDNYMSKSWRTRAQNFYGSVYDYLTSQWHWRVWFGTCNPFFESERCNDTFVLDLPTTKPMDAFEVYNCVLP
jgi:hypothetical protein